MVLNKFAEKTEENTQCSVQFLYSLRQKKNFF